MPHSQMYENLGFLIFVQRHHLPVLWLYYQNHSQINNSHSSKNSSHGILNKTKIRNFDAKKSINYLKLDEV